MSAASPDQLQVVALLLFAVGALGVLLRRDVLVVMMSLLLMLNAASLSLVSFGRVHGDGSGQVFALLVALISVVELGVGLALFTSLWRARKTRDVDAFSLMRW